VAFRGNERREIFGDDTDREALLARLAERAERYQVRLHLYCLMTNHAHLVVETPQGNLSDLMGGLLTSYANYFNARHRRAGHLLQRRYQSPLVEGDEYLLRLRWYLHLNPVFVKCWENRPPSAPSTVSSKYLFKGRHLTPWCATASTGCSGASTDWRCPGSPIYSARRAWRR
jgi:REP element-mobilizing transposase RayT